LDHIDDVKNEPFKVMSFRITKRLGLVLIPVEETGSFMRIGVMVIAKKDVEK
jgi:hypothetical protein